MQSLTSLPRPHHSTTLFYLPRCPLIAPHHLTHTHQILKNDVATGRFPGRQLVCLVVDEAHRATGKADPVTAVAALRKMGARFRLLALSATPGTSHAQVQVSTSVAGCAGPPIDPGWAEAASW